MVGKEEGMENWKVRVYITHTIPYNAKLVPFALKMFTLAANVVYNQNTYR